MERLLPSSQRLRTRPTLTAAHRSPYEARSPGNGTGFQGRLYEVPDQAVSLSSIFYRRERRARDMVEAVDKSPSLHTSWVPGFLIGDTVQPVAQTLFVSYFWLNS